ncbi:MAG: dipeptidase [Candidatus Hodarchaeales archaeon]|jgi:membrane dipeptidase
MSQNNSDEDKKEFSGLVALSHTDYLIDVAERRSQGEKGVMERRHLPTLRKGGINIICDHVGGETRMFSTFPLKSILSNADHLQRSLYGVDCMIQEANESEKISIITDTKDILEVKQDQKLGIILCLQGGSPIKTDLALLRTFYRLGIRMMNLTANVRNEISDSCMDRTNGGLSDFGVKVVNEMNNLGIIIDIAQLSPKGCLDVFEISRQPVIASNSNAKSICNHPRNLDDSILQLLGDTGGVTGIHCLPLFLSNSNKATMEDMIRHIDYITELVGVDHIGIGPDLLENWPQEKHDAIWSKGQDLGGGKVTFNYPFGFESIGDIPKLSSSLESNGYSKSEIDKIMGGNFLRVFNQVWKK